VNSLIGIEANLDKSANVVPVQYCLVQQISVQHFYFFRKCSFYNPLHWNSNIQLGIESTAISKYGGLIGKYLMY